MTDVSKQESYLQKYLVFADIKQLNNEVENNKHFGRLLSAFPTVDKNITRSILLASRGDLAPAFNALLSLTSEDIQLGLPMRRYEYLPDRGLKEEATKGEQEAILDRMISQNKESRPATTISQSASPKIEEGCSDPAAKISGNAKSPNKSKAGNKGSNAKNQKKTGLDEKLSQSVKSGKQRSETNAQRSENQPELESCEGEKSDAKNDAAETPTDTPTEKLKDNPFSALPTDENEDDHSNKSIAVKT